MLFLVLLLLGLPPVLVLVVRLVGLVLVRDRVKRGNGQVLDGRRTPEEKAEAI